MTTKRSCRETVKVLKFWILWILSFLPLTLAITSNVSDHDLEIMNLLKKFNKPYVKSIKSPDGSIIDCVLLHLQPAFDNPLLKNHTLQMQPGSLLKGYSRNHTSNEKLLIQPWHAYGRCPKGTTPIRRKTKEDILRAKSIQNYGRKTRRTIQKPNSRPAGQTNDDDDDDDDENHEYAIRAVDEGHFNGAKADINVWIPYVQVPSEFSLTQIWVSAGDDDVDLNTVEAGYQVYNQIYRDDSIHLFGYWTRDAYGQTGCYNLECSAFVQVSQDLGLGSTINPTSDYNGDQIEMTLYIAKHPRTRNWWLVVNDKAIGYYPADLFTNLLQGPATSVNWGGEVTNKATNGKHTSTEMGSGYFSGAGYQKAAYFAELKVVDEANELITPVGLRSDVTNSHCYDLLNRNSASRGEMFYYGGPGENANCP